LRGIGRKQNASVDKERDKVEENYRKKDLKKEAMYMYMYTASF
jgi:hypothetical protein